MKYAIVNGERQEAQPGLSGECPGCERPVDARCGEIRIWYWAHRRGKICDHWHEPETLWHRTWKNPFPKEWQEVRHKADSGDIHIADIKTGHGWAIEFQHSFLNPEERRAREAFYPKLVWVVNGLRRQRDKQQFLDAMNNGARVSDRPIMRSVLPNECALLRDWSGSSAPVFFDFGEQQRIWWLFPKCPDGKSYIAEFPRVSFVHIFLSGETDAFERLLKDFSDLILERNRTLAHNNRIRTQGQLQGFERHLAHTERARRQEIWEKK